MGKGLQTGQQRSRFENVSQQVLRHRPSTTEALIFLFELRGLENQCERNPWQWNKDENVCGQRVNQVE